MTGFEIAWVLVFIICAVAPALAAVEMARAGDVVDAAFQVAIMSVLLLVGTMPITIGG